MSGDWRQLAEQGIPGVTPRWHPDRCPYCGRYAAHTDPDAIPPEPDDDAGWAGCALDHAPDCEWLTTRAHRLGCW